MKLKNLHHLSHYTNAFLAKKAHMGVILLLLLICSVPSYAQQSTRMQQIPQTTSINWLLLTTLFAVLILIALLCINIWIRVKTNQSQNKNQAMLNALLDNIPFDVWAMDKSGRYILQNKTSKKNWGNIIGKTPHDLALPQATIQKWHEQRELAMNGETIHEDIKMAKNDTTYHISNMIVPFKIKKKINGVLGVAIDITDKMVSEKEKQALQQQLYKTQKLESIGRLTGGIAHDFNNILCPIIGYSELILENNGINKSKKHIQDILTAAQSAKSLVQQLLAFSRNQQLNINTVNINQIIESFSSIIRRSIREDIKIVYSLENKLHNINADNSQIEQILLNLVVNAQDAMPDGGQIMIRTENVELDESYSKKRGEIIPGQYTMLSVTDSGQGMSKQTIPYIFEPFFTTKESGKGTGLGLATVYGIVKQHHGYIYPYSETGHGTEFKIYFPITQQAAQTKNKLPISNNLNGNNTILLVEDNEFVRDVTLTMLNNFGYTTLVATNGDQAVQVAEEHSQQIDLLLTDIIMPQMNGVALYKKLSQHHPALKVLYMSGYSANVIEKHDIQEQQHHFIQKPFSMNELGTSIKKILVSPSQTQ